MSRRLWILALASAGCGECYSENRLSLRTTTFSDREDDLCHQDGVPTVDLTGAVPVFALRGAADDTHPPTALTVLSWACSDRTGLLEQLAYDWELERLDETTVTYGVVPDGARVVVPDRRLEDGVLYTVEYSYPLPLAGTSYLWPTAYFTAGDPDSYALEHDCPE